MGYAVSEWPLLRIGGRYDAAFRQKEVRRYTIPYINKAWNMEINNTINQPVFSPAVALLICAASHHNSIIAQCLFFG